MTQNINIIPNNPTLKDLLDFTKKDILLSLNCHHIGTIQSFDPDLQVAQVSINYTKTFLQVDSVGNNSVTSTAYPTLLDCPVVCLGGGKGSLTFPIQAGDECLVIFNDRDLSNWFGGASGLPPNTGRLHAYTDAIALVGIRSLPNVLLDYDGANVSLNYGLENTITLGSSTAVITIGDNTITLGNSSAVIAVGENTITLGTDSAVVALTGGTSLELDATGKLKITNPTGEFVAALTQLFTDIQNGLVTTMLGPMPLVMPTFATDLTVFQSFQG